MIVLAFWGGLWFAIQSSRVQTWLTRQVATQISKKIDATITVGKVDFALFRRLQLRDVLLEDQQHDTLVFVSSLTAKIDTFRWKQKKISFEKITLNNTRINASRDSLNRFNFSFLIDSLKNPQPSPGGWIWRCRAFGFHDADLSFTDQAKHATLSQRFRNVQADVSDFSLLQDSLSFQIDRFILVDGESLQIDTLNAFFSFANRRMALTGMNLKTAWSRIVDGSLQVVFPEAPGSFPRDMEYRFGSPRSEISFYEIARWATPLRGMDQLVRFSGEIEGKGSSMRGKNIELSLGDQTRAFFDFYANDISRAENMYLFIDLKRAQTTFEELSRIKLPESEKRRYLHFHESLYRAGLITYRGNFTGFLTDFVTYGTIRSRMGTIATDLSVVPGERRNIAYKGEIATVNFRLGELIKNEEIGNLTFKGSVNGSYQLDRHLVGGSFRGEIADVEVNDYTYRNVRLDGLLDNRMFDGLVAMNDSNLQFEFLGKLNFNPEIPVFDFRLDLQKALPGKLRLTEIYPDSELTFLMNANFSGNRFDNLSGSINIHRGAFSNQHGTLDLGGMKIQSISSGLNNHFTFTSDFFDAEINGTYHFQNIVDALEKSMYRYLPAISNQQTAVQKTNRFGYQIDVKNLDNITAVFAPAIKIETPFLLYGQMDSEQSVFELKGSIPMIRSETVMLRNIFIGNNPSGEQYISRFRIGEILLKNGMSIKNFTVESEMADNIISNAIAWGEEEQATAKKTAKSYRGEIMTRTLVSKAIQTGRPHFEIEGVPSQIVLADSVWQIDPFTVAVDSTFIRIDRFIVRNNRQQVTLSGALAENDTAMLTMGIEQIDLSCLGDYLNQELPLHGIVHGEVRLLDLYHKRQLFSDMRIDGFAFRGQKIGNLALRNRWDENELELLSELSIRSGDREHLKAFGSYTPESGELLYFAEMDHLPLVILETLIRKNFSHFTGEGTGRMKIHGTPQKILLTGALEGRDAGLTIDFTQVAYQFTDSVYFRGDTIHFDRLSIRDPRGNRGTFDGTIVHRNFQDMNYNLTVAAPRIMAINTTASDNPRFYGQMIANGRMNIRGKGQQVLLSGEATTLSGTQANISLADGSELERYDFIQFLATEDTEREEFLLMRRDNSDFRLDLTVHATPEARAQLIYDSQIGDVIRAQGEGILRVGVDNDGNITLAGSYTVERGDYLFTLQNVINKRFTIEQGGTIEWMGDPYNAIIDISAVYKLKASLYDLLVNTYDNIYQSQRIPVDCKILLTEDLSNPNIDFAIEFPTVEDRLVDELRQYFNTQEEMNRQILSLVVLGKFYTPEYLRGTYEAQNPNLIGTTASELFSNQLSNWLSQINSNVDIGLNYRPGNEMTNDEIELALSTQMFNDRVTINGNVGNNNNPNSSNNSQLVGDFDINVKLIPSGKIRFKAYNRSNNNLIYETSPYTQGVGFTFSEDFNNFSDLLKKMEAIFSRKEED